MAVYSNMYPLICIAGRGIAHVGNLMDQEKGDIVLNYRKGNYNPVQDLKSAVQNAGGKLKYTLDCMSEHSSFQNISKVLDSKTGQITIFLPSRDYSALPDTSLSQRQWSASHGDEELQKKTGTIVRNEDFACTFLRYFDRGLNKGYLKQHLFEVVPGGLAGVQWALQNLKDGKASAVNFVFRIADTESVA